MASGRRKIRRGHVNIATAGVGGARIRGRESTNRITTGMGGGDRGRAGELDRPNQLGAQKKRTKWRGRAADIASEGDRECLGY